MPRPGPRRTAIAVKLSGEEIAQLDEQRADGQTRSDWLRALIQRELKRLARLASKREAE